MSGIQSPVKVLGHCIAFYNGHAQRLEHVYPIRAHALSGTIHTCTICDYHTCRHLGSPRCILSLPSV